MQRHLFASALVTVVALLAPRASAQRGELFAFGDSLSDNGNLFALIGTPGAPYWQGRFSDGRVWVEQLAEVLGRDLRDHAIGGSTTTAVLQRQIEPLLRARSGRLPADALYVYWAGANDLLDLLANPRGNPAAVIGNAMQQTAGAVMTLLSGGARRVMVVNLPDLSKIPRVIALGDPTTSAGAAALAAAYNQALGQTIAQLESVLHIDILELDAFALTRDIAADPGRYMFRVVDAPRLRANGSLAEPANRFLFFDDIHPGFAGHRTIMRAALRVLGVVIPGDVDGDAVVNWSDFQAIVRIHGPVAPGSAADLDANGLVDSRDRLLLLQMLAPR